VSKICFVALYAYPLFNPAISHIFGGAEVRAWFFGVGLSKFPNNEVSFVVLNHGQPEVEHYGLIKVYRHSYYRRTSSSVRGRLVGKVQDLLYRSQHPLASSLPIGHDKIAPTKFIIYEKVDADLYCTFGVSNFSAELAAFCKRHRKRFMLFSSNDDDLSLDYYPDSRKKNAYGSIGSLCYYTIMQADLIVTQTQKQSELLEKRFGRTSVTVFNPIELTPTEKIVRGLPKERHVALWIGKSDRIKQPEILLDLAILFPDIRFLMILNRSDSKIHEDVLRRRPENLRIIESVEFGDIEKVFAQAFVLINTSIFEGFPNTFLQAGKFGVPILSLQVDPDGFIEKHGCGIVAKGEFEKLAHGVRRLLSEPSIHKAYSENIRRYVLSRHELNATVSRLNQILTEFLAYGL
jgi:glycosyltransferase involved in cell wall biosynthesis